MIEKINVITGHEEALSKVAKNLLSQTERHEYTSAAKIYSKEDISKVMDKIDKAHMPKYESVESIYTSPFAPVASKSAASADFVSESMPHGLDIKA